MKKHRVFLLVVVFFLLLQEVACVANDDDRENMDNGKPRFFIAPYAWMMGMDATLDAMGHTTKVDSSFSDALDKVDFAGMLAIEAVWANRFGIMGNLSVVYLKDQESYRGVTLDGGTNMFFANAALFYRIMSQPLDRHPSAYVNLDILAGLNYWDVGLDLSLAVPNIGSRRISKSAQWTDPIVGARLQVRFDDKWSFALQGHYGGAGDTDETWDAAVRIGYRIGNNSTLMLGYRATGVDRRENNGFVFDTTMHGPILGVVFAS